MTQVSDFRRGKMGSGIILAILRDFVLSSTQTTDRPKKGVARALSNLAGYYKL